MFTGIIEQTGTVIKSVQNGTNTTFWISTSIGNELRIDQSVSHNGVCLTVEAVAGTTYQVTAIAETLAKTNVGLWQSGTIVNLERSMLMNGRLDGHIVQGHVDATATCIQVTEKNGSWEYQFSFDEAFAGLVIEKGSIAINGISLTLFNVTNNSFTVAIIPYTYNHTNINTVTKGSIVNIEFDILGKYVQRMMAAR
jgi:riboflavin synthase